MRNRGVGPVLAAAAVALASVSLAGGQQRSSERPIELSAEAVILPVTVRGPDGRLVKGLSAADFEIREDGTRVPPDACAVVERPLRLVLVFDTSLSMESTLPVVRQEARRFVDALGAEDRVSVCWFASEAFVELQWIDKAEASRRIGGLVASPHAAPVPTLPGMPGYAVGDTNTYLYDALVSLFGRIDSREPTAVVLFTDGVDTSDGRSMGRRRNAERRAEFVADMAKRSWAVVFPVRYKTEQIVAADRDPKVVAPGIGIQIGRGPKAPSSTFLDSLAATSGGALFEFADQRDLATALAAALDELRSRYLLAYSPPDSGNREGFHRIEVRVRRPGCSVRTRPGYAVSGTR